MKYLRILSFCFAILSGITAFSQAYFIVEKANHTKSFKFGLGDNLKVKVLPKHVIIDGHINLITDTTIGISGALVYLNKIEAVYVQRRVMQLITAFLITGGIAYLTIDTFNGLIQGYKVFSKNVVISSLSLVGASVALWYFNQRKCIISKDKWKTKVIDFRGV
ncbi:MAG: hypothetical protein WCH34_16990 [Bacteroidota bacterium]